MIHLKKAIQILHAQLNKYRLAWYCPAPPDIMDWQNSTQEDLEEYGFDIIDYISDHGEDITPEEFFEAVGGEQQVLDDLMYECSYDEYLKIADDWYITWNKSKYPDGTIIYFHTQSGIEHVYEPVTYRGPK